MRDYVASLIDTSTIALVGTTSSNHNTTHSRVFIEQEIAACFVNA